MLKLLNKNEVNSLGGINVGMPPNLNLGCGTKLLPDFVNLDTHIPSSAINSTVYNQCWVFQGEIESPHDFPKDHFKYILADMVFEHIHPDKIPNLLYCLFEFLQPEGKLKIIVPNFRSIAHMYVNTCDEQSFDLPKLRLLREITNQLLDPTFESGGSARGHQSLWTPEIAHFWLKNEGYAPITITPNGRWLLEITAVKPKSNPYSVGVGL